VLDANELVRRAQNGEMDAYSAIFHQYYPRIFRYIRARLSNHQAAEGLTGEVFLRMIDKLPAYRITGAPFQAWLFTVARHLVWESYRDFCQPLPAGCCQQAIPFASAVTSGKGGTSTTPSDMALTRLRLRLPMP